MLKPVGTETPIIRFATFDKPWVQRPVSEMLKLTVRPVSMNDDESYELLKVKRGNGGVVSRGEFTGREVLVKSQFKVCTDDFIISKRQIVHRACGLVPTELDGAIVSNEYNVFEPTVECCIQYFNYFCFRSQMRHAFFLSSVGVHLEKMLFKTRDWTKRKFFFPELSEQQKIADFLTSVDTRIQQLTQKKTLLERWKKGLMQQLFSQTLRFKDDDGNDFPDWKRGTFSDLATKTSSNITSSSVKKEGRYIVYGASGKAGYIEEFQTNKQYVGIVKDGAGAGRATLCEPKTSVLATMDLLHPKTGVDVNYLFQFIQTMRFSKYIIGSTIPHIYYSDYKAEKCQIPCPKEQTTIANALAAMDQKIDTVAKQIEQTKTFKKGLLQQMFV